MSALIQDLHYALRQLRKSPGFTAVAVITLALGIGANTAIFSVVNAVLLRPLPYKDDGRLVVILNKGRNPVAPANFIDWRSQSQSFSQMGAAEYWTPNLTGTDNPEKLWALHVTPDIFPMLGVQPLLGRMFLPEEQEAGKEHEVVLSYSLWQSHFAGNPEIIGRSVALSGETYTVVGVMPRDFKFAPFWATKAQLWVPLALGPRLTDRGGSSLRVFARLKPGVTLEQAQAEMAGITGRLEREFPGTNQDMQVVSLREKVVGNIRPALLVLLGAVGFVLLDRLRQRKPHAAGARGRPARGNRAAHRTRGRTLGCIPPASDRKHDAGIDGWQRRFAAGSVGCSRSAGDQSGRHTESGNRRRGWPRAAVCTRYLPAYGPGIRHGASLESDGGQPQRCFEGREARVQRRTASETACAVCW